MQMEFKIKIGSLILDILYYSNSYQYFFILKLIDYKIFYQKLNNYKDCI
jgi:hypothetical protein